jgi:hypothetical protein
MTFEEKFAAINTLPLPQEAATRDDVRAIMEWEAALRGTADGLLQLAKEYTRKKGSVPTGEPGHLYGWTPSEVIAKAPTVDTVMAVCASHRIPFAEVLKVDTAKIKQYQDLFSLEFKERKTFGLIVLPVDDKTTNAADVPY